MSVSTAPLNIRDLSHAARELEATLVRQLLSASGAFRGNDLAGSKLQADMFIEALADAVAQSGGLGLADVLEQSLAEGPSEKSLAETPAAEGKPPLTSGFGRRTDPLAGTSRFHSGIDLAAAAGTPIAAVADGVVTRVGPRGGYGNALEIDHGGGLSTLYAHASALAVKSGKTVQRGEIVGQVGSTGRSTGPHLHFEVRLDGKPQDPLKALRAYGIRADKLIGAKGTEWP